MPDSKSDPVGAYSITRTRSRRLSFFVRSSTGPEQALQAAAQIRRLADVGLGLGVRSAQKKHGRGRRDRGEDLRIPLRREFQALGQHESF